MRSGLGRLLKSAAIALGVTSIYMFWDLGPLVTPTHDTVYHWSGSAAGLFVPPIADFGIFWLIFTLLFWLARRPGRARVSLWSGTILFVPWISLKNWAIFSGTLIPALASHAFFLSATIALLLLLALWRPSFEVMFERYVEFLSSLLLVSALSGVVIVSQAVWFGWEARSLNADMPLHRSSSDPARSTGKARVIWILFDELSYRQVYEHRFPGLSLPAFDALASQGAVFTHAIPAGVWTERVLPSLMTGERVDDIRSSADGRQLSLHHPDSKEWKAFDERDTVFEDALESHYSTAVAGWYNPYCRILPDVLDRCFWSYKLPTENAIIPDATLWTNILNPFLYFFSGGMGYRITSLISHAPAMTVLNAKSHISDFEGLSDATDRTLDDRSAGFVFLHLPVPHPGGIYDRNTGEVASAHSDYIDNLALADKLLGHIRSKLEQNGEWDSSTIVVMGDHSWRTKILWMNMPGWTERERAASQGEFDDRPGYLVKLPDQHSGTHIDMPFDALNTRPLLDALLARRIESPEDLSAWVKQRAPLPR